MKLRHAAGFSLLVVTGCASIGKTGSSGGWLLMVPPLTSGGNADTVEPLPKWQIVDNFSSQIDCDTSMTNRRFAVRRQFGPITDAQTPYQTEAVQILNGQCVSTDDPRLKAKWDARALKFRRSNPNKDSTRPSSGLGSNFH